jgi:heme exporter protein A
MAAHRAEGGLVIAATHQALGLAAAAELRIEAAAAAPVADVLEEWA